MAAATGAHMMSVHSAKYRNAVAEISKQISNKQTIKVVSFPYYVTFKTYAELKLI